mgnify:CR=1 FL=1
MKLCICMDTDICLYQSALVKQVHGTLPLTIMNCSHRGINIHFTIDIITVEAIHYADDYE